MSFFMSKVEATTNLTGMDNPFFARSFRRLGLLGPESPIAQSGIIHSVFAPGSVLNG
jgi:hypothetical protein